MHDIFLEESGSGQWTAEAKQRTLEDQRDLLQQNASKGFKSSSLQAHRFQAKSVQIRLPGRVPGAASRPTLKPGAQKSSQSRAAGAGPTQCARAGGGSARSAGAVTSPEASARAPSVPQLVWFGVLGTSAFGKNTRLQPPARRYRRDVQQQFRLQRAVGRRGGGGAGAGGHLDHLSLGRLRPLQQRLEEVSTRARAAGTSGGRPAALVGGWVGWPRAVQGILGGHLGA